MDSINSPQTLKFLLYLTAHHPEEFGLIPTKDNFLKVKEIFQVLILTKRAHNLKIETLKQMFSYYFRDFFEFSEDLSLVRPRECYFSPPKLVTLPEIIKFNQLFTFVKPRLWYKLSLEGELNLRERLPLFVERELGEGWARVKGALLIEVNPRLMKEEATYELFGEAIVLTQNLVFRACRGPKIDDKFINKYLKEKSIKPKEDPHIIPFRQEQDEEEAELPFRKLTYGKKKERPWKTYQKRKQRERES